MNLVDRVHVGPADLAQHRRRRDREPAIQQEPDHLPLGHQPRARTPAGTADRPTAPAASRDRRVGLRSWPRWYLQRPQGAKPRRGFQAGAARPHSRLEGYPAATPSAPQGRPRARLIPNPDRLQDHRGARTTARRYEARSLYLDHAGRRHRASALPTKAVVQAQPPRRSQSRASEHHVAAADADGSGTCAFVRCRCRPDACFAGSLCMRATTAALSESPSMSSRSARAAWLLRRRSSHQRGAHSTAADSRFRT